MGEPAEQHASAVTSVRRTGKGPLAALVTAAAALALTVTAVDAATGEAGTREARSEWQAPSEVPIECGGYDDGGRLVDPEAGAIERAPVTEDGQVAVPAVCGGYTSEGTYIGDD